MHGIMGQAWCYDRCMYTLTTVMTFTCNNNYKHNAHKVLGVQATVQINGILDICTGIYVMKAGIDIAKQ